MTIVKAATHTDARTWLMLALKLPSEAASARVRIWRRLHALGAVPIRSGIYALPNGPEWREDFEWLRREIVDAGGEAMTLEATLMAGMTDEELRATFNSARNEEYEELVDAAATIGQRGSADRAALEKLRRNYRRVEAIDFFDAPGKTRADAALSSLEVKLADHETTTSPDSKSGNLLGRIWVTRANPRIDRLASAWLVRRFIDRNAKFKFTTDARYSPVDREVRFDMFEAEYTHRGNRCTFEVLMDEAGIADPAVAAIGEMVHDIDIKDGKYGREETAGLARMVDGLARRYEEDYERLERAMSVFDDLHVSLTDFDA